MSAAPQPTCLSDGPLLTTKKQRTNTIANYYIMNVRSV